MDIKDLTITTPASFENHLYSGDYDGHISSNPVLTAEDAFHLQQRGLLFADGYGWLRISKEIMNKSSYPQRSTQSSMPFHQWNKLPNELKIMVMEECSDITLADLALSSKATFSLAKVTLRNNIDRRFVRIPNFTYSKQTLQYLGYTEQRAEGLWEAWREHAREQVERFGQFPSRGLEHAFRQAVKVPFTTIPSRDEVLRFYVNSSDTSNDWVAIMNKFGLTKELQRAILHPGCKDIRSYHTLWNWFRETLDLRLIALDDVRRASFWRSLPQRTKSYMPRPRLENHVAISPVPNCVHNPHHPNQLAMLRPPFEPPLMSIFWKPVDIYRTCGDFLGNGRLVDALSPHQVADFCEPHITNLALYQDRAVAEKMARYASVRTNGFSRAAILKVSIPLAFIARCRMVVLSRLSDAWKEVVYEHRNFRNLKEHPTLRYVNQAQLIVGDMSCNGSTSFYKMDGWEDVSDEHVLEVEVDRMGRKEKVKPMQWVFRTDTHPMQAEGVFWRDLKNVIQVEVVML